MNPANKNSLIHTAVPTLFNVPNPPPRLAPKRFLPKCQVTASPTPEPEPQPSSSLTDLPDTTTGQ